MNCSPKQSLQVTILRDNWTRMPLLSFNHESTFNNIWPKEKNYNASRSQQVSVSFSLKFVILRSCVMITTKLYMTLIMSDNK